MKLVINSKMDGSLSESQRKEIDTVKSEASEAAAEAGAQIGVRGD